MSRTSPRIGPRAVRRDFRFGRAGAANPANPANLRRAVHLGSASTLVAGQAGHAAGGALTLGFYTVYWIPVGMEGAACDGLAAQLAARWTVTDAEARP